MKPPINRMGGKSRLRKVIIDKITEHTCYVEPFFWAGWVYFGKKKSQVEVINDIDKELVNLFRMLKEHPGEVERLLQYEFISRDKFKSYKECNTEELTEIQRAVRYLYIINNSFASKGVSFGYGALRTPCQKIFVDDFQEIRDRLKNTFVENKDALDVIKRYDRETTFFFCDPPYLDVTGYGNTFNEENHIKLRDALSNIKGKFLLSINDHQTIRELYKEFKIIEMSVPYSVSRERKARKGYAELLITNYEDKG